MASDYPVMLSLRGRRCVVVGAGPVGRRKMAGLLKVGASVVLIDPNQPPESLPAAVQLLAREYCEDDLDDACLVFAATDNPEINFNIASAARRRGIPANIVDDPARSDFILPACFRRDDLTIAVATGGVSPAVAAMVRDEIEKSLAEEWPVFLEIAGKLRSRQLTSGSKSAYNQRVLQKFVNQGILAMIKSVDVDGIDRLLESELGKGYSLAELSVSLL